MISIKTAAGQLKLSYQKIKDCYSVFWKTIMIAYRFKIGHHYW